MNTEMIVSKVKSRIWRIGRKYNWLKRKQGEKIYEEWHRQYGWIVIHNDHIGEVLFISAYMETYMQLHKIEKITAITNSYLAQVCGLYAVYDRVIICDQEELDCVCTYLNDKKEERKQAISSPWKNNRTYKINKNIMNQYGNTDAWRLGRLMTSFLKLPLNTTLLKPLVAEENQIATYVSEHDIEKGKSVLLVPHARTCENTSKDFWDSLAKKLKYAGFKVYVNSTQEDFIEDAESILPPITLVASLVNYMGSAVCIQSGLSDLLVESGCCVEVVNVNQSIDYYRSADENCPFYIPNIVSISGNEWENACNYIVKKYV